MPVNGYRVAEIFGPTIQGEGRFVGRPCYFIRLGGCDYRCVEKNQRVMMADWSWKCISDIVAGDRIMGVERSASKHPLKMVPTTVLESRATGMKEVITISTQHGSIKTTSDHKFLYNKYREHWILAENLEGKEVYSLPVTEFTSDFKRGWIAQKSNVEISREGKIAETWDISTGTENFICEGFVVHNCSWCDSMHAVLPENVRKLPWVSATEILQQVDALDGEWPMIVISGGNPALWDLSPLLHLFKEHRPHTFFSVETQGTIWNDWLKRVDHVTISPKPPSSGMETDVNKLAIMVSRLTRALVLWDLKFVVFDNADLMFAFNIAKELQNMHEIAIDSIYLSTGTYANEPTIETLTRYKWLAGEIAEGFWRFQPKFEVNVGAQQHVLIHGHKLGV